MKKLIVTYLIVISMLTGCAGSQVKPGCTECAKGYVDGKYDADMNFQNENAGWAVAGGVLLPLGIALAALFPVNGPSPEKITGKSPDYVEAYSKFYSSQYTVNRVKTASIWCAVTSIVYVGIFVAGIWITMLTGF